jgi:hypothetical protein
MSGRLSYSRGKRWVLCEAIQHLLANFNLLANIGLVGYNLSRLSKSNLFGEAYRALSLPMRQIAFRHHGGL